MKRVRGPRATECERKTETEGQKTREGEEESERGSLGGKKTLYTPCRRRTHWHKSRYACVEKKGRCRPSSGASRPIVHARGWVGSLLKCKPRFFRGMEARAWDGTLVGKRRSCTSEKEGERQARGGQAASRPPTRLFDSRQARTGGYVGGA